MDISTSKYWFSLNPDTFLWKSNEQVLLYNTIVQKSLIFKNDKDISSVVSQLEDIESLYCIELSELEIKNQVLNSLIKDIVDSKFGNIALAKVGEKKPAFFVPVLKLQKHINKIDHFVKENDNMLIYLHQIDIYVNEEQKNGLYISEESVTETNIPYTDLVEFLKTFINKSSLNTINICGDNLLKYPDIELLINIIGETKIHKVINLKLDHFQTGIKDLLLWKSKPNKIRIIVEPDSDHEQFLSIIETTKLLDICIEWQFKISSEKDYEEAENIIDSLEIESYEIKPFFNSSNQDFFEKFIYLTEEDIQNSQLTKREIFAHQVLNTNDFGKISVKADGAVYANLYQPPLGTINDPINEMLYKELNSHSSWLRIRDTAPCANCIYKWLCPSPSNYELELGKPNLCHVMK